jgi:hypothetical protein
VAALLSTHADTLQHLKGKGDDGGQGAAVARLVGALLSRAKSLLAGCDGQELTDVLTAVAAVRVSPCARKTAVEYNRQHLIHHLKQYIEIDADLNVGIFQRFKFSIYTILIAIYPSL